MKEIGKERPAVAYNFSDQRLRVSRPSLRSLSLVAGRRHVRRMSEPRMGRPIQRTRFRGRPRIFEDLTEAETGPVEPVYAKGQTRNFAEVRSLEVGERQKAVFVLSLK